MLSKATCRPVINKNSSIHLQRHLVSTWMARVRLERVGVTIREEGLEDNARQSMVPQGHVTNVPPRPRVPDTTRALDTIGVPDSAQNIGLHVVYKH
jgi:hypothetical protein